MLLGQNEEFHIVQEDCIPHMARMPDACVDMSVFSPPFPALYAYTSEACDIGNSEDMKGEAKLHLSFFYRQLARILKPGRVAVVHVMQLPRMKRSGGVGLFDFRGFNIRLGERAGLVFEYDWAVRKNPQAQAIRTKSRELQFSGLESDRAKSRGALPDYLIKFRAPGENAVKITDWEVDGYGNELDESGEYKKGDAVKRTARNQKGNFRPTQVSRNQWIEWAECTWSVNETKTLNVAEGRAENDTKHICPLQLDVIERCVRLYTNPGEVVFSPFTGIGSEAYMSLLLDRRFYGCEIKREYFDTAILNATRAIETRKQAQGSLLFAGAV
jgi:hypothetical protein